MGLEELRKEIGEIDIQLISLIEKRTDIAEKIGEEKVKSGMPIVAPGVVEKVVERYRTLAEEHNLNQDNMETVARALVREALDRENSLLK